MISFLCLRKIGSVQKGGTYEHRLAQNVDMQGKVRKYKKKDSYRKGKDYFPDEHQILQAINQLMKEKKKTYFD